jgi:hypothetical protein
MMGGSTLSSTFGVYEGAAAMQQLLLSLDRRGRREYSLASALEHMLREGHSAPHPQLTERGGGLPAAANFTSASHPPAQIGWPAQPKEVLRARTEPYWIVHPPCCLDCVASRERC